MSAKWHLVQWNLVNVDTKESVCVIWVSIDTWLRFISRHSCSKGSEGGAVVRALASHQCGPGSTPGVDAICGLSLLLVLSLAPRGFSLGTPVFPSPQNPTLPNSNSIWSARTRLNEFIWTPMCFVGKQAIYNFFFFYNVKEILFSSLVVTVTSSS